MLFVFLELESYIAFALKRVFALMLLVLADCILELFLISRLIFLCVISDLQMKLLLPRYSAKPGAILLLLP